MNFIAFLRTESVKVRPMFKGLIVSYPALWGVLWAPAGYSMTKVALPAGVAGIISANFSML
jgi:hypothetical protein